MKQIMICVCIGFYILKSPWQIASRRLPPPILIHRISSAISVAGNLFDQIRATLFCIMWSRYIVPYPFPFKHIAAIRNDFFIRNNDWKP